MVLAACDSMASIRSVRAPDYQGNIERLFVIVNMGNGLTNRDGDNSDAFAAILNRTLDNCGTRSESFVVKPGINLSLSDQTPRMIKESIERLKPTTILDINWRVQTSNSKGWNQTTYLLQLHDAKSRSIVWKAELDASTFWHPAQIVAGAVVDRMKRDGLVDASCVVDWGKSVPGISFPQAGAPAHQSPFH
jgi:hypothetical protein